MLVLINSLIATVVLGREGYAQTWRQALIPWTVGAALAILQITGMVLLRAYLTTRLGLPI
jgi:cytochrome b subunit of formate dehydrogenase